MLRVVFPVGYPVGSLAKQYSKEYRVEDHTGTAEISRSCWNGSRTDVRADRSETNVFRLGSEDAVQVYGGTEEEATHAMNWAPKPSPI